VTTFPIKKRIINELFIDERAEHLHTKGWQDIEEGKNVGAKTNKRRV